MDSELYLSLVDGTSSKNQGKEKYSFIVKEKLKSLIRGPLLKLS